MDELPVGRRVAYWRARRHLSQQVFADRLGKSKSWVDKVERGVRRLDKYSVIYEIADVLQVDVQLLVGSEPRRSPEAVNCVDQVEVQEIRRALERYDKISSFGAPPPEPPALAELRKALGHAWLTYQHARHGVLARALPRLLREAQAADTTYAGTDDAPESAHLLGQAYQIAASVLRKLGEHDLCWLAADRSIAVSQRSGDPLLTGIATCRVGNALLALGRARPALEINLNAANLLAPCGLGDTTTPERLSVYGMALLQATMAASRLGDAATMRDLLSSAAEAAKEVGSKANHYWTCFGPINWQLHRAAALVELGEGHGALEAHESLDKEDFATLPPERRAHHYIDIARGVTQMGDFDRAGQLLLEGDRLAPSELRCRPIVQELLQDIVRRAKGALLSPVAELAEAVGVTA